MGSVLAVNAGSSSLKYALIAGPPAVRRVSGKYERIGKEPYPDHASCLEPLLKALEGAPFDAIGHRVVHGGPLFFEPSRVTPELIAELRKISPFDPEHLPA